MTYEEILQIRRRDRQQRYVALLVAALLHYVAIVLIRLPAATPAVFTVKAPENLATLQRYRPPAPPQGAPSGPPPGAPAAALPSEAPDPAQEPTGPVRVGADGTPPKVVELVQPEYPAAARQANVRGIVSLDVVVLKDGTVGEVTVRSGLGNSGCNEAAVEAVRRSRFEPATVGGRPVDAHLTIDFRFQ